MDSLKYIHDPRFFGVYVRKTNTQLEMSLWPEAKDLYPQFGGKFNQKNMTCTFPSGARLKFSYLELDKHKDNYQGAEFSAIFLDETCQFKSDQFYYLKSRMRSKAQNKSFMKCTCNPDRDSFVYEWVKFYLYNSDQVEEDGTVLMEKMKGCPDRSICGRLRYFVIMANELVSAWTKEEILADFPNLSEDHLQTYTFIAGDISDNPIMDIIEPAYKTQLENLPKISKLRLRYGRHNCHARP